MKKNDKLTTIFGAVAAVTAALLTQLEIPSSSITFKVIAAVGIAALALGAYFTNKPEKK